MDEDTLPSDGDIANIVGAALTAEAAGRVNTAIRVRPLGPCLLEVEVSENRPAGTSKRFRIQVDEI